MKSFRDLIVWQRAMELVRETYEITAGFPENEKFGLSSQMKRAAVSVPSNIAEGYGRNSTQDYIRFLQVASGSLYELQTQLEIAYQLSFTDEAHYQRAENTALECAKMLTTLIRKLRQNTASPGN